MKLGFFDDMAYRRPATADRAHAVDGIELVRTIHWMEPERPDPLGPRTSIKVEVIGWVVQLVCKPVGTDGAWEVLGVFSNFTVLRPGEFLQPVERVIFQWERLDFDHFDRGTFPLKTTAVDYNDTVGPHYQPTAAHCFQVVETYMNRLDPEHDFDPTALVPVEETDAEVNDGAVPQGS